MPLVVFSPVHVDALHFDDDGAPLLTEEDARNDNLDAFNRPRLRRALILRSLRARPDKVSLVQPTAEMDLDIYRSVHTNQLIDFLETAWERWCRLGEDGQDASSCLEPHEFSMGTPALIPSCFAVQNHVRPSAHVIGQMGYYCNDDCTPVFGDMLRELREDGGAVRASVARATVDTTIYVLQTHPGHHAQQNVFGGYCYVNHAATVARHLQTCHSLERVAILDLDYHAGNGTAAIFDEDPSVLVISIHCHPDHDYPFHVGFADETGTGAGEGTTLHLPLMPGTTWENAYRDALEQALRAITDFDTQALVVSLGLDTLLKDPCAIRRAGFSLAGDDYVSMGEMIATLAPRVPTIFIQEGGYRMDKVGDAAADVVTSFVRARGK